MRRLSQTWKQKRTAERSSNHVIKQRIPNVHQINDDKDCRRNSSKVRYIQEIHPLRYKTVIELAKLSIKVLPWLGIWSNNKLSISLLAKAFFPGIRRMGETSFPSVHRIPGKRASTSREIVHFIYDNLWRLLFPTTQLKAVYYCSNVSLMSCIPLNVAQSFSLQDSVLETRFRCFLHFCDIMVGSHQD